MNNRVKIAILLAGIILAILITVIEHRNLLKLHKKYKAVQKTDEVDGIISDLYCSKGVSFVTFDSSKFIFKSSANEQYKKVYLDRVLEVGDSINKKAGSDTIYVFKNGQVYYFKHGNSLIGGKR